MAASFCQMYEREGRYLTVEFLKELVNAQINKLLPVLDPISAVELLRFFIIRLVGLDLLICLEVCIEL